MALGSDFDCGVFMAFSCEVASFDGQGRFFSLEVSSSSVCSSEIWWCFAVRPHTYFVAHKPHDAKTCRDSFDREEAVIRASPLIGLPCI